MAWCPFAVHKPLSENHIQGSITPRAIILHTAVSASDSLFDFFQNHSDLESHFYVDEAGRIEQYMDTRIRADANKNANSFAVSIETEDGRQIRPWSPAQLAALIRLVTWICDTHGIPKVQIPRADGAGIGWHVQFGAPGPWTPVAKSCPGAPRIEQTRDVLIPAVAKRAPAPGGGPTPGPAPADQEDYVMNRIDCKAIPANGLAEFPLPGGPRNAITIYPGAQPVWIGAIYFWGEGHKRGQSQTGGVGGNPSPGPDAIKVDTIRTFEAPDGALLAQVEFSSNSDFYMVGKG